MANLPFEENYKILVYEGIMRKWKEDVQELLNPEYEDYEQTEMEKDECGLSPLL